MNDVDKAYNEGWNDGFKQALNDIRKLHASYARWSQYEIVQILETKLSEYMEKE